MGIADEIDTLIASLPDLRASRSKIDPEQAEALIADDDELFNAVALYTAENVDIFHEWPEQLQKLTDILKRIKPFRPWFGGFYRGARDCEPSPLGFRSWSANRSTAIEFARDWPGGGIVCERTGKVRGVSITNIATWRMRLRPESHYAGSQAEYLLLDDESQKT